MINNVFFNVLLRVEMESGWNVSRSRMKNSFFFSLMHFVLDVLVHLGQFALKVQVDVKVKIPLVSFVRTRSESSVKFFPFLHGEVVVEVEDRLLPMSVRTFGAGRKPDSFVAVEFDVVEEAHQGMDVVVSPHGELEWG